MDWLEYDKDQNYRMFSFLSINESYGRFSTAEEQLRLKDKDGELRSDGSIIRHVFFPPEFSDDKEFRMINGEKPVNESWGILSAALKSQGALKV